MMIQLGYSIKCINLADCSASLIDICGYDYDLITYTNLGRT